MINTIFTNKISSRQQALLTVLLLFLLSLFIRLPNLNRPVSKHYEFNTAVILINIESWRQAGGGDQLHYTPVMNFQHAGDKFLPNNLFIDKGGNYVYLSFGPGWYMISYFFYQLFHLPADPLYLEILNLVFNLVSILLFFYFLEQLIPAGHTRKYFMVMAGCCFMLFSPGILWFLGNGYVNTGMMLPFLLATLLLLMPMLLDPARITAFRLGALGLLIILMLYMDWFIFFLCFISCLAALFKWKQNKKYGWLLMTLLLSVFLGVALIFFQFASHMGWEAVVNYWLKRFSRRGPNTSGSSFPKMISFFGLYLLTSYLPLLALMLLRFIQIRRVKIFPDWSKSETLFLRLFGASLIFYNFLLFDWSADHEFAFIPWCLLLSLVGARFLGTLRNKRAAYLWLTLFLMGSVCQYYVINRPGKISRDGEPYASFKQFGESLKQISPEYKICANLEWNPMIEYYAGRNILDFPDSITAKKMLDQWGIKKAVWLDQKAYKLRNIQRIR